MLREQDHNKQALQVSNLASELIQKLDLSKTFNQKRVGELARLQSSLGFQSEAIAVIEKIDDPVIYSRYFIELFDTDSNKQARASTPSNSVDDSRSKKLIENLISNKTLYFGSKPVEIIDLHSTLIATNQPDLALQVLDRLSADFALERTEILASGEPLSQSNVDSADSLIARKYVLTGKVTEGVCRATAIADSYYLTKTLLDIETTLFETGDKLSQDAINCLSLAVTRIVPVTKFWAL